MTNKFYTQYMVEKYVLWEIVPLKLKVV